MKKIVFVLAAFSFSVIGARAQSTQAQGFTFGAGINLALPIGNFGDGWSFGIGGQLQGEYMFSDNLSGVATTGYTSFVGKTQTFPDGLGGTTSIKAPSVGLIPVLVGARFYPSEQFFIGAQIGFGILTGSGSNTSGFDYYPQIGYNMGSLQFILGYNTVSATGGSFSHVGLTGIYKFGGGSN